MPNFLVSYMVKFSEKWSVLKKNETLSQKFMGTVKPEAPLKHRLDVAQKKLEMQITKLDQTEQKLKQRDSVFMSKIVEATKANNQAYAKMYAGELAEIRKTNNTVTNAKLSMEQVKLRLNTVAELGDVVVTLSPCMSLIKGLRTSLGGMMPEIDASMQELSGTIEEMVGNSQITHEGTMGEFTSSNKEAQSILDEAQAMVEGQTRQSMPEPPANNSIEDILKEREAI